METEVGLGCTSGFPSSTAFLPQAFLIPPSVQSTWSTEADVGMRCEPLDYSAQTSPLQTLQGECPSCPKVRTIRLRAGHTAEPGLGLHAPHTLSPSSDSDLRGHDLRLNVLGTGKTSDGRSQCTRQTVEVRLGIHTNRRKRLLSQVKGPEREQGRAGPGQRQQVSQGSSSRVTMLYSKVRNHKLRFVFL